MNISEEPTGTSRCPEEGCNWSVTGPRNKNVLERIKTLVRHIASAHPGPKPETEFELWSGRHHRAAQALATLDGHMWGTNELHIRHPFWNTYYQQANVVLAALGEEEDADLLKPNEKAMLSYALDEAEDQVLSRDGFSDEDAAAVQSLRRFAEKSTASEEAGQTEPDTPGNEA
jgi:hypothetical protein